MRYIVLLLPLLTWAILPQSEMEQIVKQYQNSNTSSISTYTYDKKNYYIILRTEEKLFQDETLEEEQIYLKAGIKQILFNYMKKKYPKMIFLEVSELLHGSFWESQGFYHHIAQVNTELVKPIFVSKSTQSVQPKAYTENNNSSLEYKELSDFTIKHSDTHRETQRKIDHLENKSKKHPYNLKLLQELSILYKQIGDTEGYSLINERIMDAKMKI